MNRRAPAKARAFTLVEAAVSTVIVAVMIVAAMEAIGSSAEARRRSAELRTADDLIDWMLAEVASAYFEEPLTSGAAALGPDAGDKDAPRTFNDVDDYHGLAMSPPLDRDGEPVAAFAEWKCEVTVEPVLATTNGWQAGDAASPLRLVEVSVRSQRGVTKIGRMLISRQGARAFDPNRATNDLGAIELRFRTSEGRTYSVSTPTLNTREAP